MVTLRLLCCFGAALFVGGNRLLAGPLPWPPVPWDIRSCLKQTQTQRTAPSPKPEEPSFTAEDEALACHNKNAQACYHMALSYWKLQRPSKALLYFERSCLLKNSQACLMAGQYHEMQDQFLVARIWYEKSCDLNNALGCAKVGQNLWMHAHFLQARQMFYKSVQEKALCSAQPILCLNLIASFWNIAGFMHATDNPELSTVATEIARMFYQYTCTKGED